LLDENKMNVMAVTDCRSLVRTLVCGVKTITWGAGSCKVAKDPNSGSTVIHPPSSKQFFPEETALFVKLVKYALKALDVYQVLDRVLF